MTTTNTTVGGCSCGTVRYRVTTTPMIVHCCHCSWCQKETGSAFATNALLETECIELEQGEISRFTMPTVSGSGQEFVRCAHCGATLWSHYAFAGVGQQVAFLRVGTLDQPDVMPPDIHIYTASRVQWLKLPHDTAACEVYYRRSDIWSEESVARLKTLQDRA